MSGGTEGWARAFKSCDLRGPYPEEVDEGLAYHLGLAVGTEAAVASKAAAATEAAGGARVVVAGDVRVSTPSLKARLLEGLRDAGVVAVDCGLLPTPGYYFARRRLGIEVGVMVTASHSPPHLNGFKPILGPLPITPDGLAGLRRRVEASAVAGGPSTAERGPGGRIERVDLRGAYADWLVEAGEAMLGPAARRLRLVVDCGNGSFSEIAPEVLARLGLAFTPLFCEADGSFPSRSPDVSKPGALEALSEAVRRAGADLGVAFDGDGDRVGFVDEAGEVLPADVFIALLARDALQRGGPAPVVLDIKLSRACDEVVLAAGGVPVRERSGHTFMKTRVIREGAILGGEGSGHVFFGEIAGGDDGVYAALSLAALLGRSGLPLSSLAASVPRYPITRDIRVRYEGDAAALVEKLRRMAAADARLESVDGVKAHYPDGWALARASVTEPAITMRFEGDSVAALRALVERFLGGEPGLLPPALEAVNEVGR